MTPVPDPPEASATADRLARLSREIVATLNDPYAEANRRAWRNITRPVDTDPLWMSEGEPPKHNTGTAFCLRTGDDDRLTDLFRRMG